MGLLERVTTLIRANLNDLIDRAEDPEKMIKQVILDMENQFVQLKTQVAISIADLHLLDQKRKENEDVMAEWLRRAEKAVDKQHDDLARSALERYRSSRQLVDNFQQQVNEQKIQVETLKSALHKLEQKLVESKSKKDLLLARHRRARAGAKAHRAQTAIGGHSSSAALERLRDKIHHSEAVVQAEAELSDELSDPFVDLEKNDEIEKLLAEIKQRRLPAN
jgi:phage shock protein A